MILIASTVGENHDLVSFGCKDYKGETYVLADFKEYEGDNYFMFKESILQELAKKQNLTNQKSETMVTIKREQLQEIHDIACDVWKTKNQRYCKRSTVWRYKFIKTEQLIKCSKQQQIANSQYWRKYLVNERKKLISITFQKILKSDAKAT